MVVLPPLTQYQHSMKCGTSSEGHTDEYLMLFFKVYFSAFGQGVEGQRTAFSCICQ